VTERLTAEELDALKAGYGLAGAVMDYNITAAKRVHVSADEYMTGWWAGYGKDESCQIEGTQNHWRWLALLLLGLANPQDAPYADDKATPEPIARMFATIEALEAENKRLRDVLSDVAYNTSSSVPLGQWPVDHYRDMMHRCVGIAARSLEAHGD
jgi:hypothetical protein